MAKRRLRNALGAMGQAGQEYFSMLLRDQLAAKRQVADDERGRRSRLLDQTRADVDKLGPDFVQKHGPRVAESQFDDMLARLSPEDQQGITRPNFASMDSAPAARMGPARKRVLDSKQPEELPSEQELMELLQGNRIDAELPESVPFGYGQFAGLHTPEMKSMLEDVGKRREGLLAERQRTEPLIPVDDFTGGTKTTTYKPQSAMRGVSVQGERTPVQEAGRAGAITKATEQARVDVQLDPNNVKPFLSLEEAKAYAQTHGRNRSDAAMGAGSFKPEYKEVKDVGPDGKEVIRRFDARTGQELAGVQTNVSAETVTDGMRTAAAYASRAVQAHNEMMRLEPAMMRMGYGAGRFAISLANINAPESVSDPTAQAYIRQVRAFINAGLGRPESGATISPEEYEGYKLANAFIPGMNADTLAQVQQTRREALGGLQIRSGTELGKRVVLPQEVDAAMAKPALAGMSREEVIADFEASGYRVVR